MQASRSWNIHFDEMIKAYGFIQTFGEAFTKHIVDAMMKAFEEKLELEVSIPRKLHDEWEPTIKVKIKNYECFM